MTPARGHTHFDTPSKTFASGKVKVSEVWEGGSERRGVPWLVVVAVGDHKQCQLLLPLLPDTQSPAKLQTVRAGILCPPSYPLVNRLPSQRQVVNAHVSRVT
ncbi:hypothetical protein Pmani_034646 [Petrolisthes manimaculis]|uniref:Uncharacterized protein n=1 Tax=Petrolisthes manimaculis TaxID=1843537 RepID=A0AAE1NNX6_9EUCA|nr:hypothetical protein Pmani_034646 [Petrolisthes manimaculis]